MIAGAVNARREAVVPLRVRGPNGMEVVNAIVDTGFTAGLTLSRAVVQRLALIRQSEGGAVLADGALRRYEIFAAEVEWGSAWRPVLVWAVGDEALVGMRLLAHHKLQIAVTPGGLVAIEPLS
jgi:predicted aspartyl protease